MYYTNKFFFFWELITLQLIYFNINNNDQNVKYENVIDNTMTQ